MFNPIFTDPNNELLQDRLNQVAISLRGISFPTMEEYQAAVYSAVNAVLSLGDQMHPIAIPIPEGPAIVGDVTTNLSQINQDLNDVVNELQRVENLSAVLYNQAASSQNQLRQSIREGVYASSNRSYVEQFINTNQIASMTATVDVNAGTAMSTLISQTQLALTPLLGQNSIGTLDPSTPITNLIDGDDNTLVKFNGSTIEILFNSPSAVILNRIQITLDTYDPLEITLFTTSPDGSLVDDVLADMNQPTIVMDALSGKFSGNVILDFPPRQVKTARLIIQDRTGINSISLRDIYFWSRRYSASSQLVSNQINGLQNNIVFTSSELTPDPYVSITHQISYDGTQYIAVDPGTIALLQTPFWYRALFTRNSSVFNPSPVNNSSLDPTQSAFYTLTGSTSTPKGTDIVERTLQFTNVTGPIVLRDTPIPNTLLIQQGIVILAPGTDYSFNNNTISLVGSGSISVTYQTSSGNSASLSIREEYYSAYLYSIGFTQS